MVLPGRKHAQAFRFGGRANVSLGPHAAFSQKTQFEIQSASNNDWKTKNAV